MIRLAAIMLAVWVSAIVVMDNGGITHVREALTLPRVITR